jgi:uncharacterized membrane protein (UPF0127 family)
MPDAFDQGQAARRLRKLPRSDVLGRRVPVAATRRARLLGLAGLDHDEVGDGLLIPRCSSVHTFGMQFELDLYFVDTRQRVISIKQRVPPRRVAWQRGAAAVLEVPARR